MKLITLKYFVVLAAGFACINAASIEKEFLKSIDKKFDGAWKERSVAKYAEAKDAILKWCDESCSSSATLWRLARICYYIIELDKDMSLADKYALMNEGYNYADKAVRRNDLDPEAHKWMAIFSGYKGNVLGGTAKVYGVIYFRCHINHALKLNPDDPVLHYFKGVYQFETANLGYDEKVAASKISSKFPNWTFKDAIISFLRADELFKQPEKHIKFFIAYSYYVDGNLTEAREWLQKAEDVDNKSIDKETLTKMADLRKSLNV